MKEIRPLFCDNEPVEERKDILRFVFQKDIFGPNGPLGKKMIRGQVLDLGCGRGAVGAILKEVNPQIEITGVDLITHYQGENFLNLYSSVEGKDAVAAITNFAQKGFKFHFVVSFGLPGWSIDEIILDQRFPQIVKKDGEVLFIFDYPLHPLAEDKAQKLGFKILAGSFAADPYILFWENKS